MAHIESGGVGRTIPAQQQIPKKSENQRPIDYRGNSVNKQRLFREKKTQKQWEGSDQFQEDQLRFNLQPNRKEVLECRGRIQGNYPVYLPDSALYTLKLVQHAHEITLQGGVGLTMAKVRDSHWIPRLRKLVKRVIKKCYGCKQFQITT